MRHLLIPLAALLGLAGCGIDTAKDEHERFMSTSTTSKYWSSKAVRPTNPTYLPPGSPGLEYAGKSPHEATPRDYDLYYECVDRFGTAGACVLGG